MDKPRLSSTAGRVAAQLLFSVGLGAVYAGLFLALGDKPSVFLLGFTYAWARFVTWCVWAGKDAR